MNDVIEIMSYDDIIVIGLILFGENCTSTLCGVLIVPILMKNLKLCKITSFIFIYGKIAKEHITY